MAKTNEKRPDEAPDELDERKTEALAEGGELESLRAEADELRAQWMRAQADYQNLRRRVRSDHDASLRRALQPLLDDLLLVLDYLDMALASPATVDETRNLATGVAMTRDKLVQALEREDVRPIATDGAFDPGLHEAVRSVHDADAAPGTILELVRAGYTWGEVVLRHAHVVVAASDDDPAPEATAGGDDGPTE